MTAFINQYSSQDIQNRDIQAQYEQDAHKLVIGR